MPLVYLLKLIVLTFIIMTATYAVVEIQDALTKIHLYLNALVSNNNPERCQKAVYLATEIFLKFMENEEFVRDSFQKVRLLVHTKYNYYAMLILDQMMKNNKYAFKTGRQICENLFKGVWEKAWSEGNNTQKLENLKLMAKVWGYIYGAKHEQNLKKWVQPTFKTSFAISAQRQAQLKELYGAPEPPKIDSKMDELLMTMKDEKQENNNLLQAFGLNQD